MASPDLIGGNDAASTGGDIHPLDKLIAQLKQGEDYFHPAIQVAWAIGQNPISLRDAMLHRQTLSQLLEAAEMEERQVRELVSDLGRIAITQHRN